jgi:hypothetical protein
VLTISARIIAVINFVTDDVTEAATDKRANKLAVTTVIAACNFASDDGASCTADE